jgi:cobyrinic acid a,c-diamide synthase
MKLVTLSGGKITSSKDIAVLGDIDSDGEISVSDARLALRAAVKLDKLTGVYEIAAKVGNDKISVSEARTILRAAVKLENPKYWLK